MKIVLVIGFICGIAWAAWFLLKDKPTQPEQKKTIKTPKK